jgi:hypothetical protein
VQMKCFYSVCPCILLFVNSIFGSVVPSVQFSGILNLKFQDVNLNLIFK